MDKIYITGMEFYSYHGVFEAEKKLGQRFIADVVLHLPLAEAGQSDDLNKTINYADVYWAVKEIMEGDSVDLIETIAERIASQFMKDYPAIEKINVRIAKPEVPIPGILKEVAVEIERTRVG